MAKLSIPGFTDSEVNDRFISHLEILKEAINFNNCDLQLFFLSFSPGEKRPLHKHDEIRVTFIRSGTGKFIIGENEKIAVQGDIIITMPQMEHSLEVLNNQPLNLAEWVI